MSIDINIMLCAEMISKALFEIKIEGINLTKIVFPLSKQVFVSVPSDLVRLKYCVQEKSYLEY